MATVTDKFEPYIGTKEYNGIVANIQEWFYGSMVRASWCATSVSYFMNQLGLLKQIGGKNENVYWMMEACRKSGYGKFYYRASIPERCTIKRGTIIFMLNSGDKMTETSNKHVTTAYADFTFKGSGNWRGLGGNQSDSIKVSTYAQARIYAIFIPDYADEPKPEPTPEPDVKNVAKGQKWLNMNYGVVIKKYCGALLAIDGSYGAKTRAAALAVWKDLLNRKYGEHLTPSNPNFYESSLKAASKATVKEGSSGTFTYIVQLILSARGFYTGKMDADAGKKTVAAIKAYQRANGANDNGICGANMWYQLFN